MSKEDDFLLCRTFNHQWDMTGRVSGRDIVEPPKKMIVEGVTEMFLECARCGTRRFDYVRTASGVFIRRRYQYPDGYLMPKGTPRPSRVENRVRVLSASLRSVIRKRGAA